MLRRVVLLTLVLLSLTLPAFAQTYPNLPANLTPMFQYDGNVLPSDATTTTTGMAVGYGNRFFGGHSIVTDATSPIDGTSVYRMTYPTGQAGGNSPGQLNFRNAVSASSVVPVDQYYEATWFKIVGSNFEAPGTGQWKPLGYWAVGIPPGGYGGTLYNVFSANGNVGTTSAGILVNSWTFGIAAQGFISWRFDAGTILADKWYRMEILMIANTIGSSNGTLKVWLTNVTDAGSPSLVINSTNRVYRDAANPAGFWNRGYNPIWGGSSFGPKTRPDFVHIARFAGFGSVVGGGGADTIPPSTPTLIASASGGGQGNPSWTAATDNVGVQGYELLRCTGASCTPTALLTTTASGTRFYTDLLNISPSTIYGYRVRAFDAAGNRSPPSAIAYITTTATFKSILPLPDTFDRANNTNLGAAWDAGYIPQTNAQIISNRVRGVTVNTRSFETYNATVPGNDQWAQLTLSTLTGAQLADQCVHLRAANAATMTNYAFCAVRNGANTLEIREYTTGTPVVLAGNATYTPTTADKLRFEMEGTTLRGYLTRPTGQDILAVPATDASIAGGKVGLSNFVATGGSLANVEADDFVVGDFGAGIVSPFAVDAVSNSPDNETSNTTSWVHPVGTGSGRMLWVTTMSRSNVAGHTPIIANGVTANGTALTKLRADSRTDGDTINTELWYQLAPNPGSNTIAITCAGVPRDYCVGSAISFFGVDQSNPIDAQGGGGGSGTAMAASITTVADNAWILDAAIGRSDAALIIGAGQTSRVNRLVGVSEQTNDGVSMSTVNGKTPAGLESMNWTQTDALGWTMSTVSLLPATVTPVVPPTIASLVLDATGMTITPGATVPTRVRIAAGNNAGTLSFSDNVLYADLVAGRYNKVWADGSEFACAHPIDSAGVENIATNPDAWQCGSLIGIVEPLDTTPAVLSGCLPTTDLPAGTTDWTFTCNTDKSASARFSETDEAYDDLDTAMTTASLTVSGAISGLTNGSTHTYYVRSQFTNSVGDLYQNPASTVVTVTVASSTADTTPPSTVVGLACDAAQQAQVPCVWGAATDNVAVSSYNLYLCGGVACTPTTLAGNTGNVTQTVLNLAPLTPYGIGIKALDSSNNESAALSNIEYKTTTAIVDLTPPSKMMNLRVTEGPFTKSVRLGWDGGTDNQGPVTATIEQCTGVGCSIFAAVKSDISTQQLQVDLTAGTLYRFRGIFTDQAGNRSLAYSNILDVTTATSGLSGPRPTVPFGVERPVAGDRPAAGDRIPRP